MTAALPPILPSPKSMRPRAGSLRLRAELPLVLPAGSDDGDFFTARVLREKVAAATGLRLPIEAHGRRADLNPRIELGRRGEAGDGYRLAIAADRIEIQGDGPSGLRYGAETLAQIVEEKGRRLPACEVEDGPDLALRGILVDVSRGKVPTLATLKELVNVLSALKLNVLMLYTEHTFRFRRHPEIGAESSPLDAESLRELDAHAAAHHVELVPTLQSLGHMRHVLGLSRYRHLAETDRLWSLSPAEEGTYDLLRDLYDEYLPNFRSRWFNANCDEPVDLGQGKSSALVAERGLAGVYLDHVRRIRDLARGLGKRTMIWADVVHAHPDWIPQIDRDLVLLDWWYESEHDYDRVRLLAEQGLAFLACPGTSSWNALFPRVENSIANVEGYAAAAKKYGARGLVTTDWGDGGHYNLLGNSWLGYAWGAQQAWSGDHDPRSFDRAFSRVVFGDRTGAVARVYRELGAIHDAGFDVFNASPLQSIYFDDVEAPRFLGRARPAALRRSLARLQRVKSRLAARESCFRREKLSYQELLLAADASLLAVRKGQAALAYLAWREAPERMRRGERNRLAAVLSGIASEQKELGRRLHRLWLARSRPSNWEITRERLHRSIRSLRRASENLTKGRPAPRAPTPS